MFMSRRKGRRGEGDFEYEVKWVGRQERHNTFIGKAELEAAGLTNLMKHFDEKLKAKAAGIDRRPTTTSEIQRHLDIFGLPAEFGTYSKIRTLSGGQKVKLVLAAAMWVKPHVLVLDEPTNFLDSEALKALSQAIDDFKGGVIMVSHNERFSADVCDEVWAVDNGRLTVKRDGEAEAGEVEFDEEEDGTKGGGNSNNHLVDQGDTMKSVVLADGRTGRAVAVSKKALRRARKTGGDVEEFTAEHAN